MVSAVGIIQARMGSERLPGKVLAPLSESTLLGVIVARVGSAKLDELWLATTREASDDLLAQEGNKLGLSVHRGDADDVLSRFVSILQLNDSPWVVRLTADNPFTDAAIVDRLLAEAPGCPAECQVIAESQSQRHLPLGYAPQVAKREAVLELPNLLEPGDHAHRSHVLSWFYDQGQVHSLPSIHGPDRSAWRWTVDTEVDLRMARAAFDLFGSRWDSIGYEAMVELLDRHPEVAGLNGEVAQKSLEDG